MSGKSGKSSSRSRGPNFSKEEQLLLFTVMEQYTHIIESKKTDSIKHIDKQNAWSKVTEVFNANTKGVPRSRDNIKCCYRNIKSKLKKQHSEAKMLLSDIKRKKTVNDSFKELSEAKLELVNSQKISLEMDIQHRKCKYALELEDLIKENKHREEMREKQLLLINMKIKEIVKE